MPRISVAIPAFNSAAYVAETIESVLAQTADHELLICDDGSSDGTGEICRSYARAGVRYLRFPGPSGQAANWNRCIAEAKGEYIVILHGDDVLLPQYLTRAADFLDRHPEVGFVHCAVDHVDSASRFMFGQRLYDADCVEAGAAMFERLLRDGCVVNPAGVMVRREIFTRVGPFTTDVKWGIDWHMWLRIALVADIGYLAEPLARYREHGGSGTVSVLVSARNGSDELWVVDDIFELVARSRPELLHLRRVAVRRLAHRTWCWAEEMCRHGQMAATRAGVWRSITIWPPMAFVPRAWALWIASYVGYAWFTRTVAGRRRLRLA